MLYNKGVQSRTTRFHTPVQNKPDLLRFGRCISSLFGGTLGLLASSLFGCSEVEVDKEREKRLLPSVLVQS